MFEDVLKGNFRIPSGPKAERPAGQVVEIEPQISLTTQMEAAAFKKLGGSITFVHKTGCPIWRGPGSFIGSALRATGKGDHYEPGSLGEKISLLMAEATKLKTEPAGLANAQKNKSYFKKTIDDLPGDHLAKPHGSAIVISGGPSLHRTNVVDKILTSNFNGDIIAVDGALGFCLRRGLIPDYLVCLDTRPDRIKRWFGDTELTSLPQDDYFRRQQYDPEQRRDEVRYNTELIELVNQHGPKIKAILSTSVDISVIKRATESGMDIHWWTPMYDDPDQPDSMARKLWEETKVPLMMTGGNVGTAAWIFAYGLLRKKDVALVGMDLGYTPSNPLLNTEYYYELVELMGEDRVKEAYYEITNPYTGETWYTDPTFGWFRDVILDLAKEATCTTYNCTEGGTLFGDHINFIRLDEFLKRFSKGGNEGGQ